MNEQSRAIPYLKALVIVMGVLIVVGFLGLGYTLYQKTKPDNAPAETVFTDQSAEPAAEAPMQSTTATRATSLGLPSGSHVRDMAATSDRLVLNVHVPGQGNRIIILDLRKGNVIGDVALEGAAQ
jgi:hypothetical protein